jgi:CO/xanthine dehydrogenase Mo-binding subunit
MTTRLSRRAFVQSAGALVVTFVLPAGVRGQTSTPNEKKAQYAGVDAWLAVGADGSVTLYTGKVELGTGIETALSQIAAEELDVPVSRISVVQGDTDRSPDQGYTVGSKSISHGAPQVRAAAAEARAALLELAAGRLGVAVDRLSAQDGVVSVQGDAAKRATYGELVGGRRFNRTVSATPPTKPRQAYRLVGTSVPRVDIPTKATGTHVYVHNVRLPGMLHGRTVRPPSVGAVVVDVDEASVRALPGNVRVVRKANFVGVVADREEQAIAAAQALKVTWRETPGLPDREKLPDWLRGATAAGKQLVGVGDPATGLSRAAKTLHATYTWPFQMHGSIGPSCGVADVRGDKATVWAGSQGVFGLRDAIAALLGLKADDVRVIFAEASGCYGHNGVDDAAADAAMLSQAVGKPVRVQWMRHDEHAWEPKGPAMVMDVRGGLDTWGAVTAWDYQVWTPTHSTRPRREPGNLLAGQLTGHAMKFAHSGGDRNAPHTYVFPNDRVLVHWVQTSPIRPSALRGLGAPQNTFANESFMDELAALAGADPLAFRLAHLKDPRAIAVLEAAARRAGWQARPSPQPGAATSRGLVRGRGIAFVQYENDTGYAAIVSDVEVDRTTGGVRVTRIVAAHDCGMIVNPDGVRNQVEGNVIQAISRTLKEEVQFDRARVTSVDWISYPILTFPELPDELEVVLIDRPDQPSLGAGEPATCPVPAAIANAVFDATGARLRSVPFTPDRVKAVLERS